MSASPFRSHLLQQWARTNQKRPPAAVVPWLTPTPRTTTTTTIPEDSNSDSDNNNNNNNLYHQSERHIHHRHRQHGGSSRRHSSRTRQSHSHEGGGGGGPPSLSSVDSGSFVSSASTATSWAESYDTNRKISTRAFSSSSSVASIPHSSSSNNLLEEETSYVTTTTTAITTTTKKSFKSLPDDESHERRTSRESYASDGDGDDDEYSLSSELQSMLMNRRTATRLAFSSSLLENREAEKQHLIEALDRAVKCAQMAPNHKRTEPFSFKRFLASSQASKDLAEISYQVTLAKTQSIPNAEGKRKKWLDIPAFLVALVHDNQNPLIEKEETEEESSLSLEESLYEPLPYSPPETERQLEDYAAASAAVQNVLLSLHSEGIGSKWATGPVIRTRAFRKLVQAAPTDRVVALIMIGGTTKFQDAREEQVTQSRRHRRRALHGDLLEDLA